MSARLWETPDEMAERSASLLDPDAFDDDAVVPWGDRRWAGRWGRKMQAIAQERARATARLALSALYPTLAEGVET